MAANLRAVAPGDEPPRKPRVTTVSAAAAKGDRLAELRAMRKVLARVIDDKSTPARDLAALTRRLIEVSRDIESEEAKLKEQEAQVTANDAGDAQWRPEAI